MNCVFCKVGELNLIVFPKTSCVDKFGKKLPQSSTRCLRCGADQPVTHQLKKVPKLSIDVKQPLDPTYSTLQLSFFDSSDHITLKK